jgi:hypothetical protein
MVPEEPLTMVGKIVLGCDEFLPVGMASTAIMRENEKKSHFKLPHNPLTNQFAARMFAWNCPSV